MQDRLWQPRTFSIWLLPPVLALAAWLRLWELPSRGLLYWDEGKFCLEGLRLLGGLQMLFGAHGTLTAGKAVGTAKPTHALLIALSYALLGIRDYSPLILDALCSTATVGVIYLLARRLFGPGTALLAAVLLAVSGYDIMYARSALSESDANLLFAGAVLLWTRAWDQDETRWYPRSTRFVARLPAAVIMGAAFTTNYRLAVYIAVVLAFDLALLARRAASWAPAALAWACGLAVFPLAWEAVGLMARARGYTLFQSEITYHPTSYLAEVAFQLHQGKRALFHFAPTSYLGWYTVRQGWPVTLLLLVGLALSAARKTVSLLLPALLVAVPYVVYTFAPFIVPRNLDTAVPFGAVLGAATLVFAAERMQMLSGLRLVAPAGVILVVALTGGVLSWQLTGIHSGFARAASFLQSHNADGAIVSNEVMKFYLRDSPNVCDAAVLPRRAADLPSHGTAPYAYAVIDVYDTGPKRYLLKHGNRVARYPIAGAHSLAENPVASENGLPPGPLRNQHVDVYFIAGLHFRDGHSVRHPGCSLDRLA